MNNQTTTPIALLRTAVLSIVSFSLVATGCGARALVDQQQEAAILSVLQALRWEEEICVQDPCSTILVDTTIFNTNSYVLNPADDSVAFSISANTLAGMTTQSARYIPTGAWDQRQFGSDTAFATLGFFVGDDEAADADSLLVVVLVVPPASGLPKWVYARMSRNGDSWIVGETWVREG